MPMLLRAGMEPRFRFEIVRRLFEYRVDVNVSGIHSSCGSALHEATAAGYSQIVELLLKNGANVAARDGTGQTALRTAFRNDDDRVTEKLLEALEKQYDYGV